MDFDTAIFYTNNLDKAIDFYQDLIGLEIEYRQGDKYVSFIFPNKTRLGIKKATGERERPGLQTIIVSIEDIDNFYQTLKEKNINLYEELKDESWGKTFSILDVDGNRLEFLKRH